MWCRGPRRSRAWPQPTAMRGPAASEAANSSAVPRTSPFGTTRSTRPHESASVADELAPGHDQILGTRRADQPCETLRPPATRDDP